MENGVTLIKTMPLENSARLRMISAGNSGRKENSTAVTLIKASDIPDHIEGNSTFRNCAAKIPHKEVVRKQQLQGKV